MVKRINKKRGIILFQSIIIVLFLNSIISCFNDFKRFDNVKVTCEFLGNACGKCSQYKVVDYSPKQRDLEFIVGSEIDVLLDGNRKELIIDSIVSDCPFCYKYIFRGSLSINQFNELKLKPNEFDLKKQ